MAPRTTVGRNGDRRSGGAPKKTFLAVAVSSLREKKQKRKKMFELKVVL